MRVLFGIHIIFCSSLGMAQFAPAVGQSGTTAIHKDSIVFVNWARSVEQFQPGPQDISVGTPLASFGQSSNALNMAEGNSIDVVSLGDGGSITLGFDYAITNEAGPDFAVFENAFDDTYLELAHVEVSTDGVTFVRIPSESAIQTDTQVGSFGSTSAEQVHNLAGKYRQGYGVPFDLVDISDSTGINIDSINYVRIVDVVGSINSSLGSFDALGTIINDPYPTPFESGGFDLDAIGVIHDVGPYFTSNADKEFRFNIYPNPTKDELQIETQGEHQLALFGLNGQLLWQSASQGSVTISLLDLGLEKGIYILMCGDRQFKVVLT